MAYHLTRNPPRRHAAAAAGNELLTTRNGRGMLVGGFRVTWDTVYYRFSFKISGTCTSGGQTEHTISNVRSTKYKW